MCVTMVEPATDVLGIVEIPIVFSVDNKGVTNKIFEKMTTQMSRTVYKALLCHYPWLRHVIYDNCSEFKLYFAILCHLFGIELKPTTVKKLKANAISEHIMYWSIFSVPPG